MWGNRRKPFLTPARKSGLFLWLFQLLITEANILDPEMWPGPPSQAHRWEMELPPREVTARQDASPAEVPTLPAPAPRPDLPWGGRHVREGTRSGRGAPTVPPVSGLMPSGPGRGQRGPPPRRSWVLAVATSLLQVNCLLQVSLPGCFQLQGAPAALSFSALSGGPSDPFKGPQAAPALTRSVLMTALGGRSSWTLEPVSGLSCRFGLRTELS